MFQLYYKISISKIGAQNINIYLFDLSTNASHLLHAQFGLSFMCCGFSAAKSPGIILCMRQANERRCYNVTSSLIGWVHTQKDPWISPICFRVLPWHCDILILSPMLAKILWRMWLNKSHESTEICYIEAETNWPPFSKQHFQMHRISRINQKIKCATTHGNRCPYICN